jgi:hypothetical protein
MTPRLLALVFWMASCGVFEELQSAESAEGSDTEPIGSGSSTSGEADGDACVFPLEDRCSDQDTLHSCDPVHGTATVYDCAALCGSYLNFTCLGTGTGQHGCWCVASGQQKVLSCGELEDCLRGCVTDDSGACADGCFSRTTTSVVRMYGALVHCAHDGCHDTCIERPEACASCIDASISQGLGGCGLPRSVCDEDRNDEPGTPYG